MYKALIVDDESIIRMGIRKVIPWESMEIHQVDTASNGIDALRIIREEKPHVLITDINMAEMTGIEMIEQVRVLQPGIKIIVITGYDSFEYVHKCIKMHVEDFFLKPVDEDELAAAVSRLVLRLEEERQEQLLRRAEGAAEQLLLEKIMCELVRGRYEEDALRHLEEIYRLKQDQAMQLVFVVPILREEGDMFQLLSAKNICVELLDKQEAGITFQDEDGGIALCLFHKQGTEEAMEQLTQLSDILLDELGAKPRLVLGFAVKGLRGLQLSYNDAGALLQSEEKSILDVIQPHNTANRLQRFYRAVSDIRRSMSAKVDNVESVLQLFQTFEQAVVLHNVSHSAVRKCCFELAASVCFSHAIHSGSFPEGKLQALSTSLAGAERDEAFSYTRNVLSQILCVSEENLHDLVSRVKTVVNESLAENISVLSLAAGLYISPNYLSRLFKKVTGEGCNEYIVRKRIEKAKDLLEATNLPSGKIASMVGYQDINYFSIAFKKHVGMSPTKYREAIRAAQPHKDALR